MTCGAVSICPGCCKQAEARQLDAAAQCARAALTLSGGAHGPAWPLLALVLSAQQRIGAAAAVVDAGLLQAGPRQEWLLRKIKVLTCCCKAP